MSSQRPKSPQDAWLLELIPPREGASVLVWGPRPSQAPNNYRSPSFPNLNLLVSPIPCTWRDRMTVSLLPECDLMASCEHPVNCMLLLTTSCRGGNGFSLELPQWVTKLWMPEPLHVNCVTSSFQRSAPGSPLARRDEQQSELELLSSYGVRSVLLSAGRGETAPSLTSTL